MATRKVIMKINTKTKQAAHLTKNDTIVLTNQTSGKQNTFKVAGCEVKEDSFPHLPVRVYLATPELFDKKSVREVGYRWRDNVEVVT